jgi:hypothetical protein
MNGMQSTGHGFTPVAFVVSLYDALRTARISLKHSAHPERQQVTDEENEAELADGLCNSIGFPVFPRIDL